MRTRRDFLKQGAAIAATATLPVGTGATLNLSTPQHTTMAYRGTIEFEVLLDSSGAFNGVQVAGWEWEPVRTEPMNALIERSQNTESSAATPGVDEAHALIDKSARATPRENQETDAQKERKFMPRYDLKHPCKNCPFRNDETRISFESRERAIEIEEWAYRQGFPCHLSAQYVEDDEGDNSGYVFGEDTQHCIGYIIMQIHEDGASPWPGIENDDELLDKLGKQVDMKAPVFESVEEFFDANTRKT